MVHQLDKNPQLYSPAVKWNVQPGSITHLTEFFGPVLGVMKVKNLEEAVELVNQTGYGLTSGLESLDDREQEFWREHVRAGNLYINRVTTGAIVLRQPFGGMGKSAFGPGIKAGGPNYVAQLMNFTERKEKLVLPDNEQVEELLKQNPHLHYSLSHLFCPHLLQPLPGTEKPPMGNGQAPQTGMGTYYQLQQTMSSSIMAMRLLYQVERLLYNQSNWNRIPIYW